MFFYVQNQPKITPPVALSPCLDPSADSSSGQGRQQLTHTVTNTPRPTQQTIYIANYKLVFNRQQLESVKRLAADLHIPNSAERGATTQEADWIGGADEVLQFLYQRKPLPKPLEMQR